MPSSSPPAPDAAPGGHARVGRYALLGRLGRGGMGEVHRARAYGAAGVTKDLCIKRIRKSRLRDPAALARFVDEARLWMRLSHANIVPVFDFGRMENDYFLAMEWVDGCDLRRLLDDAAARADPLPDEVVLYVGAEIARALAYLHGRALEPGGSVAHCDLKPSNVLLSRSSEVKLADFGVAVAARSARTGGTEGYIPPTEARDAVDGRADLYALGRVILELAAGVDAPSAERAAAATLAEQLVSSADGVGAHQVAETLEALLARARVASGQSPRELLADRVARVPSRLEATEPTEVQTDASFADEGRDWTGDERAVSRTTLSRPTPTPTPPTPTPTPLVARPWRARVLAVVALVGLATLAWMSWPSEVAAPRSEPSALAEPAAPPTPAVLAATAPAADPGPTAPVPPSATPPTPAERARPRARITATEPPAPEPAAPTLPGILRINARPWAEVTIDGVARGSTPIIGLELPAGRHEVRLVNPVTGQELTSIVELDPEERRDVVADLRGLDRAP